jgi:hypothetical protein
VLLLIENHDFTAELFAQPFDEFKSKPRKAIFVGNDKHLDIASDNSLQNGKQLSPPKIESASNFCDNLCAWVSFSKCRSLSSEVISLTMGRNSGVENSSSGKLISIAG